MPGAFDELIAAGRQGARSRSTKGPGSGKKYKKCCNSLGVHRGPAIKVQLRFHRTIAASIKQRTWHASQQLKERSDGSVAVTLNVSDDYALRSYRACR